MSSNFQVSTIFPTYKLYNFQIKDQKSQYNNEIKPQRSAINKSSLLNYRISTAMDSEVGLVIVTVSTETRIKLIPLMGCFMCGSFWLIEVIIHYLVAMVYNSESMDC